MTITIENPEVEARIHAYATSRGLPIDKAIIAAIMNAEDNQDSPLSGDDLARALQGKAELEAGQSVSLEESFTRGQEELRRRFGMSSG